MKFLVDECCEAEIVSLLRSEGHEVLYVPEFKPGAADSEILPMAFKEKRILLTEDKDFGELVYRLRRPMGLYCSVSKLASVA
jgi:predicted nuclease of predicted toxin-antitoxin system